MSTLPLQYLLVLEFLICFAIWWLVVIIVMNSAIQQVFRSKKILYVTAAQALKLLFVPQAALLSIVTVACHQVISVLGL